MVLFISVSILLCVLICFPGLIPNAQLMTPPSTQAPHNQNNGRLHLVSMSIEIDFLEDQGQHPLPLIETHPMGNHGEHVPELCFSAAQSYFLPCVDPVLEEDRRPQHRQINYGTRTLNGGNYDSVHLTLTFLNIFMQAISNHPQMLLSKEMMYGPYLEVSKFHGCVAFESNIFVTGSLAELPQRSRQRRSNNLFWLHVVLTVTLLSDMTLVVWTLPVPVVAPFIGWSRNSRTARNEI
jgi:hypothetical protein